LPIGRHFPPLHASSLPLLSDVNRPVFVGNEENHEGSSQGHDPEYAAEVPTNRLRSSERKRILMFRFAGKCRNCPQTFYAYKNW